MNRYFKKRYTKKRTHPVCAKANQRQNESQLHQMLDSPVWKNTCWHSMKVTQHRQLSSHGWHLNSVHFLRSYVSFVRNFVICFVSVVNLNYFAFFCGRLIWHTQLTSRSVLDEKGDGFFWAIFPANPSVWRSWVALLVCMPSTEAKYPGNIEVRHISETQI